MPRQASVNPGGGSRNPASSRRPDLDRSRDQPNLGRRDAGHGGPCTTPPSKLDVEPRKSTSTKPKATEVGMARSSTAGASTACSAIIDRQRAAPRWRSRISMAMKCAGAGCGTHPERRFHRRQSMLGADHGGLIRQQDFRLPLHRIAPRRARRLGCLRQLPLPPAYDRMAKFQERRAGLDQPCRGSPSSPLLERRPHDAVCAQASKQKLKWVRPIMRPAWRAGGNRARNHR